MELEDFLSEQNIARYRKLLDRSIDETERRTIVELLAEEKAKLKDRHQLDKPAMSRGARKAAPSRLTLGT
jgi:hypothetical protein